MKRLSLALTLVCLAVPSHAWDTSKNPDRIPSASWGLHTGDLPGIIPEISRYNELALGVKIPLSNSFSLAGDYTRTRMKAVFRGTPGDTTRYGGTLVVYFGELVGGTK